MAVDSSEAGYLRPGTSPPYDVALEDFFQQVIVGITGLPGASVRPRYQPDPPAMPAFGSDWAAFGVSVEPTIWNAYKHMEPDGSYTVEGTEVIRVNVSFYGPRFQELERSWRDGIQIGQNRDALTEAKIAFVEFSDPVTVPALLKEQWVKRVDVRGTFHRWAVRNYPVLTFQRADVDIYTEDGLVAHVSVNPPSP